MRVLWGTAWVPEEPQQREISLQAFGQMFALEGPAGQPPFRLAAANLQPAECGQQHAQASTATIAAEVVAPAPAAAATLAPIDALLAAHRCLVAVAEADRAASPQSGRASVLSMRWVDGGSVS